MLARFASSKDAPALLAIYNHYISTPVTFEYTLPSEKEFSERIAHIMRVYPYIVLEKDNDILGYAYAHEFRSRKAYQWGAELSIYLSPYLVSKGVGKKLYALIIALAKLQGIKTVYGYVTLPNPKSQALHQSMGFLQAGTYHNAGFKQGGWYDVALFEKSIGEYTIPSTPILPMHEIPHQSIEKTIQCFFPAS